MVFSRPFVCRSVGHAFVKNNYFVDFWALLPLPNRTQLMAVYPALFLQWKLITTRPLRYSRYRYWTLGTLISTESSVLMSVPRYYHDDDDGDDDGDKTAC